jgi:hypothetical protein
MGFTFLGPCGFADDLRFPCACLAWFKLGSRVGVVVYHVDEVVAGKMGMCARVGVHVGSSSSTWNDGLHKAMRLCG